MESIKRARRAAVLSLLCLSVVPGCFWDQDMVDQPSAKPQEARTPPESDGVPTWGGETLPTPANERELFAAKDAAAGLHNPVAASPASIERGEAFYDTHCLVCHGQQGLGDGPVGRKFVDPSPVDLNDPHTQDQTDGQIFFTITRGRVVMPAYRDAMNAEERWDLVNFIRARFGRGGAADERRVGSGG